MQIQELKEIDGKWLPILRDMTPEEVEYERQQAEEEEAKRHQQPTQLDRVEAQAMYTAVMTDTLIEGE